MTDIVPFGGGVGLMTREDLAKSLSNAAMSMPAVSGGKQFLKMDKNNGDWVFGQEETVVEADSLWAINPQSYKHGWVAWDSNAGGAPVQEFMAPVSHKLSASSSLPPLGLSSPDKKGSVYQLEYQQQWAIDLVCVASPEAEDVGVICEYKQSSVGAQKLYGDLTNRLMTQLNAGDDIVAVVKLTHEKYKHKKYGWIHNPVLNYVEWRQMGDASTVEDKPEPEPEPERAPRRRAPSEKQTVSAGDVGKLEDVIGAGPTAEELAEEAALKAEYEAEQAAAAANPTPRRRVRR
jgi:hypothetical protein